MQWGSSHIGANFRNLSTARYVLLAHCILTRWIVDRLTQSSTDSFYLLHGWFLANVKNSPCNLLLAFSHDPLVVKSPSKHTGICTFVTIKWSITFLCKDDSSLVKLVLFTQWLFNLTEWNPAVHFSFSSYN